MKRKRVEAVEYEGGGLIVVAKTGAVYSGGDTPGSKGEADTAPLLDYLTHRYPGRVAYFGLTNCEHTDGVQWFEPDLRGIDYESTGAALRERLDPVIARVNEAGGVGVVINACGWAPTWSWPDNPARATVFNPGVRYAAPALYLMHKTRSPRVCVLTDPKCYPRDGEMATWEHARPAALLSQSDRLMKKTVQGRPYMVRQVLSKCEYWGTYGLRTPPVLPVDERPYRVATCANGHFNEARLRGDRRETWDIILRRWLEDHACVTAVCGGGWEKHELARDMSYGSADAFKGIIPTFYGMLELIGQGECGPMITQVAGFNSTKPRLHALVGSVPLFVGTDPDHPHTYDADERLLPLSHPTRVDLSRDDDLERAAGVARTSEGQEVIQEVLAATEPDFSLLDECIEAFMSGSVKSSKDTLTEHWLDKFGGYEHEYA